ncbi:MAG: hypothetical protein WDO73_09785 [Ignavibacteriota bacterium]
MMRCAPPQIVRQLAIGLAIGGAVQLRHHPRGHVVDRRGEPRPTRRIPYETAEMKDVGLTNRPSEHR